MKVMTRVICACDHVNIIRVRRPGFLNPEIAVFDCVHCGSTLVAKFFRKSKKKRDEKEIVTGHARETVEMNLRFRRITQKLVDIEKAKAEAVNA